MTLGHSPVTRNVGFFRSSTPLHIRKGRASERYDFNEICFYKRIISVHVVVVFNQMCAYCICHVITISGRG